MKTEEIYEFVHQMIKESKDMIQLNERKPNQSYSNWVNCRLEAVLLNEAAIGFWESVLRKITPKQGKIYSMEQVLSILRNIRETAITKIFSEVSCSTNRFENLNITTGIAALKNVVGRHTFIWGSLTYLIHKIEKDLLKQKEVQALNVNSESVLMKYSLAEETMKQANQAVRNLFMPQLSALLDASDFDGARKLINTIPSPSVKNEARHALYMSLPKLTQETPVEIDYPEDTTVSIADDLED